MLKENILGTLPEHKLSHLAQLCSAIGNGEKVVASQLPNFASKAGAPIGEEDFCFTEAARIEQNLARSRMAGVILEAKAQIEVTQRYPGSFSTPASVYQFVAERQQLSKCCTRFWCRILFQLRSEL